MLDYYAYVFAVSISVAILSYIYIKYARESLKSKQNILKDKSVKKTSEVIKRKVIPSVACRQKSRIQERMDINYDDSDISIKDNELDNLGQTEKKIGVKKARKLEEKKKKKELREQEELERAIKKKLDEENTEKEKKIKEEEEESTKLKEANLEAEKIEQEQKEQELYEEMKINFEIEEEGINNFEDKIKAEEQLDNDVINYLKSNKVVMIEELSGYFNMKTQVCVDKIKQYLKSGNLTGVVDDRGKFIHINDDEYMKVTKFIMQRGRIHIKELVENSNKLIKLC